MRRLTPILLIVLSTAHCRAKEEAPASSQVDSDRLDSDDTQLALVKRTLEEGGMLVAEELAARGPTAIAAVLASDIGKSGLGVSRVAWTLCEVGKPAIEPLAKALSSSDPAIRHTAAIALDCLGPKARPALESLKQAASKEKSRVLVPLLSALRQLGTEGQAIVVEKLRSGSPKIRLAGLRSLKDQEAADDWLASPLLDLLRDSDTEVRALALDRAGELKLPKAIGVLIEALDDPATNYEAARALGRYEGEAADAVKTLLAIVRKKGPSPREDVNFVAAVKLTNKPAEELLFQSTGEAAGLRPAAVGALGRIGVTSPPVISVLAIALGDEDRNLRVAAATALGNLGPPALEAVDELVVCLTDPYFLVASRAAEALGKIGGSEAEAALLKLLSAEDYKSREETIEALGNLGSKKAVAPLIQALEKDESRSTRAKAADALARLPFDDAMVTALMRALQDPDWLVRGHAATALGTIGAPAKRALSALQTLAGQHGDLAADSAKDAIAKISATGRTKTTR